MEELLSVVVPVYNSKKSIVRCIDSILGQRYQEMELILVDDGSTDGSGEICDAYSREDGRVRVHHKENGGVSSARNAGIQLARGKYLAFVDSDDFVKENIYEIMIPYARQGHLPVCNLKNTEEKRRTFDAPKKVAKSLAVKDFFEMCENFSLNSPWNKVFLLKNIWDNHIVFRKDLSLGEDLIFNLNYIRTVQTIDCLCEDLYFYDRADAESLSQKYRTDFYYSQVCILEAIQKEFAELNVDFQLYRQRFYTLALDLLLQSMDHQYRKECKMSKEEIICFNDSILKSALFQDALRYGDTSCLRREMVYLYSHSNYKVIYYYVKFISLLKRI